MTDTTQTHIAVEPRLIVETGLDRRVADIIEPQMRLTARRITELAGFRQPADLCKGILLKRKTRLGA